MNPLIQLATMDPKIAEAIMGPQDIKEQARIGMEEYKATASRATPEAGALAVGAADSLASMEIRISDLCKRYADEERRGKEVLAGMLEKIRIAETLRNQRIAGLDLKAICLAEHVIEVFGTFETAGEERRGLIEDLIKDVIGGCGKLKTHYFGQKNYDRWHGQRCDCEYRMGPSHGHVTFSIALSNPNIQRLREGGSLTPNEVDAVIYYLRNLEAVQRAEDKAREESK